MVAGGSGITPMYQVANAVLADPRDKTRISLIYANVAEEDILMRERLDALAAMHPNFTVHYVLNKPPATGWKGSTGFVSPAIVSAQLPAPGPGVVVLRCGPPPMNRAVEGIFNQLGYPVDTQFEF